MRRYLFITCLSLTLSMRLHATNVAVQELSGWYLTDGTGFANEVFQAVDREVPLNAQVRALPLIRAIYSFKENKSDCFIGGDKKIFNDLAQLQVRSSELFLEVHYVISTLKSEPMISSLAQLKGKRIGVERGIDINILKDDFSDVKVELGLFESHLKMLKLNRISAILGYYPDHHNVLNQTHFDPNFIQYSYTDRLNCSVDPKNEEIINKFNMGLKAIKESGTYDRIWKKYFGEENLLKPDKK
ncbi:transporter substrate-binding domain-containing protein [Litoribrevibacter euphylliae]|uniref:Transporter substrate-binding domain-containing protein n=1 Tax=Litoribrevibacter euphylliae TaxID=1834034 RepID=A0ABV7HAN2_9GAMM